MNPTIATEDAALVASVSALPDVAVRRPPHEVLKEAQEAAAAIKSVIDAKPKKVMMNGEVYLEFEDWQTVARFYGLAVGIEATHFVDYGEGRGWEATAVVRHVSSGEIISRAEAMCLTDEPKWRTRTVYEWREANGKRERVAVGEEPVPLFQLRSMAQTRASAKALRQVLAWVVVLAGYRPTPAEELDGMTDGEASGRSTKREAAFDNPTPPQRKTETATGPGAPASTEAPAAPASAHAGPADDLYTVTRVVELKKGEGHKGPWVLYGIETAETGKAQYISTFDRAMARMAAQAAKAGQRVRLSFTTERKGQYVNRSLEEIAVVEAA